MQDEIQFFHKLTVSKKLHSDFNNLIVNDAKRSINIQNILCSFKKNYDIQNMNFSIETTFKLFERTPNVIFRNLSRNLTKFE